MIESKKTKMVSTYISEDDERWLSYLGDFLVKSNEISKNSKYQVLYYLIKKTINEIKQMAQKNTKQEESKEETKEESNAEIK